MATYSITINERTTFGKQLLLFLKGLGLIKEKDETGVKATLKACDDADKGHLVHYKDMDDFKACMHAL